MDERQVKQITNRTVLLINSILSSFLSIGYIVEFIKGTRSLQYVVTFVLFVIIPIAAALTVYLRNRQSDIVKYITLSGYMIIYSIALTTSNSPLSFVYIFPIMVMYILYFNMKLTVVSYSYVILLNVVVIGYKVISGQVDAKTSTDVTIQFAAVVLFGISIILSTKISNLFNSTKINNIKAQQLKQEEILVNVLRAADIMDKNANELKNFMSYFSTSMGQVTSAVDEFSKGAHKTSENMAQQSLYTSRITEIIDMTSKLSKQMGELSRGSSEDVNRGFDIVNQLNENASVVNNQSKRVEELMLELKDKTGEILGITSIISGISAQTNLLSLNASIEAARAGESGKGFAVVADEIRQLADQSKQSTSRISTIINDLNSKVLECFQQIECTKLTNNEQNEYIRSTKAVYENISANTHKLVGNIDQVNEKINTIVDSNNQIKESISTIVEVSQQTAASSQEASAMASDNMSSADKLIKKINEIIETAKEIKKYTVQ